MSEIKLYNTLSRKKEIFKPIKKSNVKIYSCGPTVYWYAHAGNFRTYIFSDLLKRMFLFNEYEVEHVMNITDVDDKTIKASIKEGKSLKAFTRGYEKIFLEDLEDLNIIKPEILRATDNIKEMVEMIKVLLKKEVAYKAEDGIYFSVSKFKNYGKLAGLEKIKVVKERIGSDEYDKDNVKDFALWKFYDEKDGDVFWETEIGKGRPGWHIECSAMSCKALGENFDIHTGAIDLIFPHHTNEIAQSESTTGKKFVNYWMHAGFLNMASEKMSKSKGNILTLRGIKEVGFSALEYRYLCLTTHYRKPLGFSLDKMNDAKISYERLKRLVLDISDDKKENKKYLEEFQKAINDDLNIPKGLQILWNLVRDKNAEGKFRTVKKIDAVLGLRLFEVEKIKITKEVEILANEREKARKKKDWKEADRIRNEIKKRGFVVEDSESGPIIKKI